MPRKQPVNENLPVRSDLSVHRISEARTCAKFDYIMPLAIGWPRKQPQKQPQLPVQTDVTNDVNVVSPTLLKVCRTLRKAFL